MNRIFACFPPFCWRAVFPGAGAFRRPRPDGAGQGPAALAAAPAGLGYYTVKRGDTLYRIASNTARITATSPPGTTSPVRRRSRKGRSCAWRLRGGRRRDGGGQTDRRRRRGGSQVPGQTGGFCRLRWPAARTQGQQGTLFGRSLRPPDPGQRRRSQTGGSEARGQTGGQGRSSRGCGARRAGRRRLGLAVGGQAARQLYRQQRQGIDLGGKAGDLVLAAADGKVLYAGTAIKGYGNLVIIGHKGGFNSVYAHNRKVLVEEKQLVTKGQKIAEMGNSDSDAVKLHFEVRKRAARRPMTYLPKR